MAKVLVISASLRGKSNSEIVAQRFVEGALDAGHEVEFVSLKGKQIRFCIGCLTCQNTGTCVLGDDANAIAEKAKNADTLVFATPVYYYEMSGQLKTLLDRMNPLYDSDYSFRNVYMLLTATDDDKATPDRAVNGLKGWIECFPKATFQGYLFLGGVTNPGEAETKKKELQKAYDFGKSVR